MTINFVEFSTLALAHFIALLSPGPDFILIMGSSFKYGYCKTFWACLGIASANGIYILLAIGGFSVLRENMLIFWGMKLVAAGYLFYLGVLLIRSSQRIICAEEAGDGTTEITITQIFLRGFISAILNPKNAIFYLSLMALIVSQQTSVTHQLFYGAWMFSAVLIWDMLVSLCIGNFWVRKILNEYTWQIERATGMLLMFVGVFIVLK